MPHRRDYSNVVSAKMLLDKNNDTLVTSTPSLAEAQLVTFDNYIEGPAVMTALQAKIGRASGRERV